MDCCPSADFKFLPNGIEVHQHNNQADAETYQFFPFRAIQSISYNHSRPDGGTITILIADIPYRYHFPCSHSGKEVYQQALALI